MGLAIVTLHENSCFRRGPRSTWCLGWSPADDRTGLDRTCCGLSAVHVFLRCESRPGRFLTRQDHNHYEARKWAFVQAKTGSKTMGDPQRSAGGKHLQGCAQAASILTRGRAPCHHVTLRQQIPPLPLVAGIEADHTLCADGTPDGWRHARTSHCNAPFPRQHHARGVTKPCSTVGEPPVEPLAHNSLSIERFRVWPQPLEMTPCRRSDPCFSRPYAGRP
jgi:hypothetical protein